MIKQRDLILVPFPFSDQSRRKVRPVIIISNDNFNDNSEDILVVGVTSNISRDNFSIELKNDDLEEGKLITKCRVKIDNILKLDKELIMKKIGRINKRIFNEIIDNIIKIIK